ncbi:hypothetical protein [Flammeovirga sp. EKP202]|uniref:hypothetical protein n=1 Tax=Flammeovirga sp. EKP202 TaxID=2770592 RepID=UPI00165FE563|nr:hypothetical protein [Flammeovirga sp. EKP202]MBD0405340.1 hypothetical protein [Flammeovirga sp. EKP202]
MSIAKKNERKILERAHFTFSNALNTPKIRQLLELNGYHKSQIEEGLLISSETESLYKEFDIVREELKRLEELTKVRSCQLFNYFDIHRQALTKLYENDHLVSNALKLNDEMPSSNLELLKEVERMYYTITKNIFIKDKVKSINIDEDALEQIQYVINDIKEKREVLSQLKRNVQALFLVISEKQQLLLHKIEEIKDIANRQLSDQFSS